MSTKKKYIGLFGLGTVGTSFYALLNKRKDPAYSISKVCVKHKDKHRSVPENKLVYSIGEIFNDSKINIIIELTNDPDFSFEIAKISLKKGLTFISANKAMLADHIEELKYLESRFGGKILYEAAVCGAVPVLRLINNYFAAEKIIEIRGIINGSTNFILGQMEQKGLNFEEAIYEAKKSGFAETDPSADITGLDAERKLRLLCHHAFGINPSEIIIFTKGIESLKNISFDLAKENGGTIKLIAKTVLKGDQCFSWIAPTFIPSDSELSGVHHEENGILLKTEYSQYHFWKGKGAGGYATASAVLSDLVFEGNYLEKNIPLSPIAKGEIFIKICLHFKEGETDTSFLFDKIIERNISDGQGCCIGEISLLNINKMDALKNQDLSWYILEDRYEAHPHKINIEESRLNFSSISA